MNYILGAITGAGLACLLGLFMFLESAPRNQPLTNEEVINAARDCERMGLRVRFEHALDGSPVSYRCGS